MKACRIYGLACVALALALPAQVIAQTAPTPDGGVNSALQSTGFDNPVATATLAGYRGGTEVVHNEMTLAGTTAGNTAINVATGNNTISAGAFSSMSGLPVVIQNSGANVLIQNAVILNLQIN
ncbi:hypothetical protein [Polaromonas sp.]|uniref:hypothetical protein n=1 Tax=Polaromonas sp. TaxID=1869339 RepID=UPI0017A69A69|nr:hypothetical protein [Polaromonas sp.]NMM08522.1 hypothetical protein [Polaromonas sp.]